MAEVATRKRRPRLLWLVGAIAFVGVIAVAGVLAVIATYDYGSEPEYDVVTDESQMAITTARLDAVEQVVRSLPDYPDADPAPGLRYGCSVDSDGDGFQPRVTRVWNVRAGTKEKVARAIRADLAKRGWTVPRAADRFGDRTVTFASNAGWVATGSLGTFVAEHVVFLEIKIEGDTPCSLRGHDPEEF